MATVIDDNTGEEVEVRPVEAVAAMSAVNILHADYPKDAGKRIEQAMAAAATNAMSAGESDPTRIRAAMLKAREVQKAAMRAEMRDIRSQQQAAQNEHGE